MNNVTIILLTWNGIDLTRRCLESLARYPAPRNTELLVVDNGSTDGTVAYLKHLPGVTIIDNGKNLGYAKAVNSGIRAAAPESDILLLNNDVELMEEHWLERLLKSAYTDTTIGIAGVKILMDNGRIQHCGAYMPIDTFWGQQIGSGEVDVNQYAGVYECESVVFACALIKRSTIDLIGDLCEDFFAYFEDSDYCLRAGIAGLKTVIDGRIRIRHSENSSTRINKVSHDEIFQKSRRTFIRKWSDHLDKSRYTAMLDWHSIMNFPTGYAGTSRSLMESMDKVGVRLSYKYVYGPETVFPVEEPDSTSSYILNCIRRREFGKAHAQVVYGQGDVFERNGGTFKIGFTMLEVDGLPKEWVRQANLMDEVWVPSSFNMQTFRDSGVEVPIRVVPLGIHPAYFSPSIASRKLDNAFTFLSNFEWGERKAPEILLRAFADEFSRSESVCLICKVNNFDPSIDVRNKVSELRLPSNGGRTVFLLNKIIDHYQLGALYTSADCFVLPTRGEGWGMPILEAMACGLPVIATDWSAHTDFMNNENAYPLEVERLVPAIAKCPYYDGLNWAEPSYEHLRQLMRHIFENQEEARNVGRRAADIARTGWSWDRSAEVILQRIRQF